MKKEATLHLLSTISSLTESLEADVSQQMVEEYAASFYEKDHIYYIFYQETDPESQAITSCKIQISDKQMIITRKGASENRLEIEVGKRTFSLYQTPFGQLSLELETDSISFRITEEVFHLQTSYKLFSEGVPVSAHSLLLEVTF